MIEITIPQMEKLEEKLKDMPEKIPIVTARAINRAAEQARTQASRSARKEYHIRHRDVLKTIKIKKAYPGHLFAEVRSVGSPIDLTKFKVRPNKPYPVRGRYPIVSVKRGSRKQISGGFVISMGNGYRNVFTRVGKKRYPIRAHYGPSVPQMLGSKNVSKDVEEKAMQVLEERLDHEINRVLGGNA